MYSVQVRGLGLVLRASRQLGENFPDAAFRLMVRVGNRAVTDVKQQLYPGHGLRTGHLRRSIHMKPDRMKQEVRVGTNVVYAPYVELGRRRTRFRGYRMFGNTFKKVPGWIEQEAREALREMERGWTGSTAP